MGNRRFQRLSNHSFANGFGALDGQFIARDRNDLEVIFSSSPLVRVIRITFGTIVVPAYRDSIEFKRICFLFVSDVIRRRCAIRNEQAR